LTSQNSTQSFPNSSSSTATEFSYIIPYGQSQECDIYGPLCQTGSITVAINLTTATTATVLPCSSYLTAQSAYLHSAFSGPYDPHSDDEIIFLNWAWDWQRNFGQSPESRSYAQAYSKSQYTFTSCGSSNTVISLDPGSICPSQIPAGFVQHFSVGYIDTCCGNCSLDISELRLYYFPDRTVVDCHYNQTTNQTSTSSAASLAKRMQSLVGDGSIAVVSGTLCECHNSDA